MTRAVANWWDGVELWLTQLPFPLQVVLAIVVLVPGCWAVSAVVDRLLDVATTRVAARRLGRGGA